MQIINTLLIYSIIYFIVFIFGVFLGKYSYWIFYTSDLLELKEIAVGLNMLFIGLSALLTTSLVWFFIARKIYLISKYRKKYPAQNRGRSDTFKLVSTQPNKGEVYLMDEKTKRSHHIENETTMRDLYFYRGYVMPCESDEFNKYEESQESIDTSVDIIKFLPLVKI